MNIKIFRQVQLSVVCIPIGLCTLISLHVSARCDVCSCCVYNIRCYSMFVV